MDELTKKKQRAIKKKIYVKQPTPPAEEEEETVDDAQPDGLNIKAVSFKSKKHKTIESFSSYDDSEKSLAPLLKYAGIFTIAFLLIGTIYWFVFVNASPKAKATDKDFNESDFSIVSSSVSGATQDVDMQILDMSVDDESDSELQDELEDIEESKKKTEEDEEQSNSEKIAQLTGNKTGWKASFQSLGSLNTTEDRSLVMLPAWLIDAAEEDRCFGNNPLNCLPENVMKHNKKVCIKTTFPDGKTEISEVIGYFGSTGSTGVQTLSFDEYTARRRNIRKLGIVDGVTWKITNCV